MGTIRKKALKSGANSYTAQIVRRKFDYTESRTFDTRPKAERWMKKREKEIDLDIEQGQKPIPRSVRATTLAQAIDKYIEASRKEIGKTKEQVLRTIKEYDIAEMACERIGSQEIIRFAQELHSRQNLSSPSTVGNYLSHLSAVFKVMRPMYGIQLDEQAMRDAQTVCKNMGIIAKSEKRERRPTMAELDALMAHFEAKSVARPKSCPMHMITAFAMFSTRRQSEISRLTWRDYDPDGMRIWVRKMKHPGDKQGNDTLVELPDPCMSIISAQPRSGDRIFPYNADAITAAFTRACRALEIKDLHFHDLRHEGTSRLAEMGRTVPQLAAVTGHRSWSSLERYTHVLEKGDRFENWRWLEHVT